MNADALAGYCLPVKLRVGIIAVQVVFALGRGAEAATYEVGPGRPLAAIGEVPWEKLLPGDTVLIHARAEPYREKFVIGRTGKPAAPITVRGVPDAAGRLPVLDGAGATTRPALDYWGDTRSVIKIGGAVNPPDTTPRYIVVENLDIRGARPPYTFTGADGQRRAYARNAAAITVEKAEHLTIRNCILHDCGNGLFISSSDQQAARDILVEGNHIFSNGNPRSGQEHNVYSAAIGLVFQFNRFGPLRTNCLGNNLKDRSAGLVVRCNWIEGGNKELDLVDAEDSALIRRDPGYREAFVCGNIFLKLPADGHPFLVHCGGDSPKPDNYRKGALHFYNNTIVSYRTGTTTLFRFSSNAERCDFRNNIVHLAHPKAKLAVVESTGRLELSHNWFNPGWKKCSAAKSAAVVQDDGASLGGATPGFVDLAGKDFRLTANSPCRNAGGASSVDRQYVPHQAGTPRANDGKPDIGAFEFGGQE